MNNAKRALLIANLYLPNVGGVENSIRSMAKELQSRGLDVDIVCSNLDQSSAWPLPSVEQTSTSTIYRYGYARGALGFVLNILRARKLLDTLAGSGPAYSLVVARSHSGVIALRLAGIRNGVYVVPSVSAHENIHRNSLRHPKGWLSFHIHRLLQLAAFRFADRTVVFSKNVESQIARFAGPSVAPEIISPGVDHELFQGADEGATLRAKHDLSLPADKSIVLCLGRFTPVKGFEQAVRALPYLPEDVLLLFVGEGPCKELYLTEARRLGVDHRLVIRPRTLSPERFYQVSSAFVFTSTQEAFGQVLLEATSCGLPVVAFRNSDHVETATEEIYGGFSFLVNYANYGDPLSLSEALKLSLSRGTHAQIELQNEVEEFRGRYSWSRMVDLLQGDERT